jgi:allantoate deiminase
LTSTPLTTAPSPLDPSLAPTDLRARSESVAQKVIDACHAIAQFSESPANLTRTYLSPPFHDAHEFLGAWMRRLGMTSHVDAAGNLRGLFRCGQTDAPRLVLGSHIDTVPDAGAYDGVLGVVIALAMIEQLAASAPSDAPSDAGSAADPLPYDIEVVAFSEEEGVRFAVPFIGSRALIGDVGDDLLSRADANGVTLAEAIRSFGLDPAAMRQAVLDPASFAFVEIHIEQGPVLEDLDLSLGVVEAIAGQSRYELAFHGAANHAGTSPMHLRKDALAGAAEWIAAVERRARETPGLVATVGRVEALPGATNVIPGEVRVSLDIRHASDAVRIEALEALLREAERIASSRGLALDSERQFHAAAVPMDPELAAALEAAARATGARPHRMVSGAGHDAMVLAKKLPAAMLFLRSPGGVSHHPAESVRLEDVQAALDAGLYFLQHLQP